MNNLRLFSFLPLAFLLSCTGSTVIAMNYKTSDDIKTFANAASASIAIELINQLAKSQLDDKDTTSEFINNLTKATHANSIRTAILARCNPPCSGKEVNVGNAFELVFPTFINLGLRYAGKIALVKTFSEKIGYHTLPTQAKETIMGLTTQAIWFLTKCCLDYNKNNSIVK